jgi:hypothetical protein
MLIQEAEEEEEEEGRGREGGKRRGRAAATEGPRNAEREGRAKDRSALRRFSPLVVKRGYKAQRDGLGESCARCARLFFLSFFSGFFFFLFALFFFVLFVRPPASPEWGPIVFDARQFNARQRGLAFLPLARAGRRGDFIPSAGAPPSPPPSPPHPTQINARRDVTRD